VNRCFLAAAVLAFVVGLVHTVLGEALVFRRMRRGGIVPTDGGARLAQAHVRILWATWHVVTVFGWAMAALLLWLAREAAAGRSYAVVEQAIAVAMLAGAALVLFATRGRHPGWAGLLGVAVLVWWGRVT
jgi:hypothetical protein